MITRNTRTIVGPRDARSESGIATKAQACGGNGSSVHADTAALGRYILSSRDRGGAFMRPSQRHIMLLALVLVSLFTTANASAAGDTTSSSCSPEAEASPGFRSYLPDCRAYEMVSPANKNGAKVVVRGTNGGAPIQASGEGDAITYQTSNPIEDSPGGNTEDHQVFSRHGSNGWFSKDITPAHEASSAFAGNEYFVFSEDLSSAIVEPSFAGRQELDVRDNLSGNVQALVTAQNVAPQAKAQLERESAHVSFAGAAPNGRNIVFSSGKALTPEAVATPELNSLFEWSSGVLRLVSVLPNGTPANVAGENSSLGGNAVPPQGGTELVRQAISGDGSRVFWQAGSPEVHLYVRDFQTGATTRVDAAQGRKETEEEEPRLETLYQTASSNGSLVFFRDAKRLTPNATAGGANNYDLYAFNTETGVLNDLTIDPSNSETGQTADVRGAVLGASEDGSYVYFVANGVLTHGATPGNCEGRASAPGATCNLYVTHDQAGTWTTTFIAQLSAEDAPDWGETHGLSDDLYDGPAHITARVSPDGRYLAFMSKRNLIGYDNVDSVSGASDEEVYLYGTGDNKVVCASCNPRGAQPVGAYDSPGQALLADIAFNWEGQTLAGNIPGGTQLRTNGQSFSQSRYLSDSGRLFFNGADSLVPQDTNGREDVYEYEPEGVGGCASGSLATHAYGGEGCVALISSGTSSEESVFADASASGDDAFFVTADRLSSEDVDGVYDMYDAHVCSAGRPCAPTPTPALAACTTSEACRPGETGPVFASPPSTALSVGGNLASPSPGAAKKAISRRRLTNAQKLARALKSCRKNAHKNKRAACERTVRKRYGPKKVKSRRASAVRGSKR